MNNKQSLVTSVASMILEDLPSSFCIAQVTTLAIRRPQGFTRKVHTEVARRMRIAARRKAS